MKHKAGEGEIVESGEGLGKPFVIACQTPKACGPSKAAFNHPSARQQYEAMLGLGVFNDLQLNAVSLRRLLGALARIALVHIGQLHALIGNVLQRLREFLDLRTILFIGRGHMQCEQLSQRIDRRMPLLAFDFLASVISHRIDADPPFSALLTLWLSTMASVGEAFLAANSRHFVYSS